ncbi:hypothetical protein [Nonomuraea sp. NPDC049129]|uniref:hypothetical protein n=1 Tax=Nonomuraea sp. NPDC049129 TaxID=3155272 RepID=UPI0034052EE9
MNDQLPAARRPEDYLLAVAVLTLGALTMLNQPYFAYALSNVGWISWIVPGLTALAAANFAYDLLLVRRIGRLPTAVVGVGIVLLVAVLVAYKVHVYWT